jgi:hypothetical protein
MITVVRWARVLALLVIAALIVSLVVALGTSDTGAAEKVVLLVLIAGCLALAATVSTGAAKARERLRRP